MKRARIADWLLLALFVAWVIWMSGLGFEPVMRLLGSGGSP